MKILNNAFGDTPSLLQNNDPHPEQGTLQWAPLWPMRNIKDQLCNEYEEPHQDRKRDEAFKLKAKTWK
jgi:hypothetical protein